MSNTPARQRLFIAVGLSPDARAAFTAAQDELRRLDLPVRWVAPHGAHLTLKFLGDTDPALVTPLGDTLRAVATEQQPFALRLAAPDAFPNWRRPRVLWLGLTGALDRLQGLHAALEAALTPLGIPREHRPFAPHLTLGRVRDDRARALANAAPRIDEALTRLVARRGTPLPVATLHLIRSNLHPAGARYTTLRTAPLGAATPGGPPTGMPGQMQR